MTHMKVKTKQVTEYYLVMDLSTAERLQCFLAHCLVHKDELPAILFDDDDSDSQMHESMQEICDELPGAS